MRGWPAVIVVCALTVGCTTGNDLGGAWRVTEMSGEPIIHDPITGKATVGIELLFGHYGTDLEGLVRFYRTADFQFWRKPLNPDRQCSGTYMRNGTASADTYQIEFDLDGCLPGAATESTLLVRGIFRLDDDELLQGELKVLDDASLLYDKTQTMTFTRIKAAGAVDSEELICETPNQDAGNFFNCL